MDSQLTPPAMRSVAVLPREQLHGSTTTAGQSITQPNPPGLTIRDPDQATQIGLLLHHAKPVKRDLRYVRASDRQGKVLQEWKDEKPPCRMDIEAMYPGCRIGNVITTETVYPNLSDEEQHWVQFYSRPCHPDTIHEYLLRLAMEKTISGDDTRIAYKLADYVQRLTGATELQMYLAVEHFIEDVKGDWFPTINRLKKRVFGEDYRDEEEAD